MMKAQRSRPRTDNGTVGADVASTADNMADRLAALVAGIAECEARLVALEGGGASPTAGVVGDTQAPGFFPADLHWLRFGNRGGTAVGSFATTCDAKEGQLRLAAERRQTADRRTAVAQENQVDARDVPAHIPKQQLARGKLIQEGHIAKVARASFSTSTVDPPPSPMGMRRTQSISSALSPAECESASKWMLVSSAISTFGMNLTMTPTTEIWIQHFAGDFTAQARMMTNLGLISSVAGFFLKPVLASLTDSFGRKPLMYSSPMANTVLTGGMVVSPRSLWTTFLAARYCFSPLTYEAQMLARQAAMGDMFSNDSKRLGRHLARMTMIWPVSSIFCPIVSGFLTARFGPRIPLFIATILYAFNLFVVTPRVPETLPHEERKPFVVGMGSSPLTAVKLFTKGPRLRRISLLQLLDSMSGQEVCWNLSELHASRSFDSALSFLPVR